MSAPRMALVAAASAAAAMGGLVTLAGPDEAAPAAALQRDRAVGEYALDAARELQAVRTTGDAAGYVRAERLIARALRLSPRDQAALTERAQLALARHDFDAGLRDARAAVAADPSVVRPYGPLVDAYVELGRYADAERALQAMLDRKPEYAGFTRASYLRELHGDLTGALEALRAAESARSGTAESAAFAASLTGSLELQRGRVRRAARAFGRALSASPESGPAQIGLARVEAARGRTSSAIARLRRLVGPRGGSAGDLVPLAELELAAGRRADAMAHLARARAHQRSETRSGVDVSVERALLEADHGSPADAVALARQGLRGAPDGVRAQHALGWALTRAGRPREGLAWARRSLRLGWRDPLPLLHAGLAAAAAGEERLAERWLRRALRGRAWLGLWQAAKADVALARLDSRVARGEGRTAWEAPRSSRTRRWTATS